MTETPHIAPDTPFNLAEYVLAAGTQVPDKIALSILAPDSTQDWTYHALRRAILGTATGFLNAGVSPGDRLLMRVGNAVEFPVAYLAAIAVGIIPIPTSSQLTAPETQRLIDIVSPHTILHDGITACPDTALPVLRTSEMGQWYGLPPANFARGDANRLAYIIFTSGTSGTPRAVMHAHRAILARRMMFDGWYGLTSADRMFHAGAFNWTYTLGTGLMDPWTVGATALIGQNTSDHARIPQLLADHKATIFAAAPGVYRNILKSPMPPIPTLRHGLAAGEKLPLAIRSDWTRATGTPVFEAFGMSECSTFISSSPNHPLQDPHALGRPQAGRDVVLMGEDGPVNTCEHGIISISINDPGLTLGYYGAASAMTEKIRDGYFLTGDLGYADDTGEIHYIGRADDMMNAGGYRVSPLEVEAAMAQHPALIEVAATDVEVKPGVRLIALYYTSAHDIPDGDLENWAKDRLARYKQPRLFHRVPTMPRNANGKLMRRALTS